MSTVYVIQNDNQKDFQAATRYGKLEILTHKGLFPDSAPFRVAEFKERAAVILKDFHPYRDFILLNGSPVYLIMVGMILRKKGFNEFKCLMYDREEKDYYEVKVETG